MSRSHRSLRIAWLALAAALALGWSADARAYTRTFSAGSLIIPAQQEYQTDCGMTSAYGLIYALLVRNGDLVAANKKPVTIYWVIEPKKLSHHRCDIKTNALPIYSTPNENDGCDFAVQSANGQPVTLLANDNASENANFDVDDTTYNNGISTRSGTVKIDGNKTVMKYSGGAWVIDATDRATVLTLFQDTTDTLVHPFRDGGACNTIPVAIPKAGAAPSHHTKIHSARSSFTAPIARMMNVKPAQIALIDAGAVAILQAYLANAGLAMIMQNGAYVTTGGTPESHGLIYDSMTPLMDLISTSTYPYGALNMPDPNDATQNFYQVVWAPHWVAGDTKGDIFPAKNTSGDSILTDGVWTHLDPMTGTQDDPVTNALKNIARFADSGNGVFAECASIESYEGSYLTTPACASGQYACECTDPTKCVFGDTQPWGCDPGYTAACNACYKCAGSYTLDTSTCGEVSCVSSTKPCVSSTDTYMVCSSNPACYHCQSGYTLSTTCPAICKLNTNTKTTATPIVGALNSQDPTFQALACDPGYQKVCVESATSIDVQGRDATRFQATNRFQKNGLDTFTGPDCTDGNVTKVSALDRSPLKYKVTITGDCFDFHPSTGGPGNPFIQKGNFNFSGTGGHIHNYFPPASVGSYYYPDVLQFATSWNATNAARRGWDFATVRHKDGDPGKGMVYYLAGHDYSGDAAGTRLVLNTLLNLGFSDAGVELARSEPVGYVTRKIDPATGQWVIDAGTKQPVVTAKTVFQGTYVQRPPPGPYQDWIVYSPTLTRSWRFPYIDGHLRAYDLDKISTTKQDFKSNSLWDAATLIPLPANRTVTTALNGTGNGGWTPVNVGYAEAQTATCTGSGKLDANGGKICALSDALAACGTANITQANLAAGDPTGSYQNTLGMFVQQVRGHCAAHDKTTGNPIFVPTDLQCDDITTQKNRAKLGGVDHSSPAIVGPSRYLGNDPNSGIKWGLRPVVAYAGGRDGMLHAFFVSAADPAWSAEGKSLPAGIAPGTELWAFVPPGQLCGLATNSAMVDAVVNVVDVFGNFPRDADHNGVYDLTNPAEKPDGIRRWRTILIAAAGDGGSEIFALDVTNPLRPALLWDLAGARENGGSFDAANPATYASLYVNPKTGIDAKSKDDQPSQKVALYDYRNLGLTYGTAVGMLWRGNAYQYVAYIATNAADYTSGTPLGFKGIEVFAIDVITGKQLWHWQNQYTVATDAPPPGKTVGLHVIADNTIPGRPALVDADQGGTVDRVYVGDMEGHMWELDAATGKNVNFLFDTSTSKFVGLPFFGTPSMDGGTADAATKAMFTPLGSASLAQEPLTSPIGIGRLTSTPCSVYKYLEGRLDVAQGTMGVDWAIAPFEAGNLFVLPAAPEIATVSLKDAGCSKLTGKSATVDTRDRDIAISSTKPLDKRGVLLPQADWQIQLGVGERLFGMPKIVGNDIVMDTSNGSFAGDITDTASEAGTTKLVNASNPNGKTIASIGKAYGGALVIDGTVVVTSATSMIKVGNATTPPTGATETATSARNRFSPANFGTWEERPNEPR